eukprot:2662965-Pleurochrysis_carterae.AAC.2
MSQSQASRVQSSGPRLMQILTSAGKGSVSVACCNASLSKAGRRETRHLARDRPRRAHTEVRRRLGDEAHVHRRSGRGVDGPLRRLLAVPSALLRVLGLRLRAADEDGGVALLELAAPRAQAQVLVPVAPRRRRGHRPRRPNDGRHTTLPLHQVHHLRLGDAARVEPLADLRPAQLRAQRLRAGAVWPEAAAGGEFRKRASQFAERLDGTELARAVAVVQRHTRRRRRAGRRVAPTQLRQRRVGVARAPAHTGAQTGGGAAPRCAARV